MTKTPSFVYDATLAERVTVVEVPTRVARLCRAVQWPVLDTPYGVTLLVRAQALRS